MMSFDTKALLNKNAFQWKAHFPLADKSHKFTWNDLDLEMTLI